MALDPLTAVLDLGGKIMDKVFPDKTQAEAAKNALQQAALQGQLAEVQAAWTNAQGQLEVNKAEAGNTSIWVSGWRPGIGWACAAAFAWTYLGQPVGQFLAALAGHPVQLPDLDMSGMMPVLLGMLGLGGMRTYEKVKNATSQKHA